LVPQFFQASDDKNSLDRQEFYQVGIQSTWKNKKTGHLDLWFAILSEISVPGYKSYRGIITYAIGQDQAVYHRYFKKENELAILEKIRHYSFSEKETVETDFSKASLLDNKELEKSIYKEFGPRDYPSLNTLKLKNKSSSTISVGYHEQEKISIDSLLGTVTIVDQKTHVVIKLFISNFYIK
jgi:hypothetical protein